jgi:hypothetical protein
MFCQDFTWTGLEVREHSNKGQQVLSRLHMDRTSGKSAWQQGTAGTGKTSPEQAFTWRGLECTTTRVSNLHI